MRLRATTTTNRAGKSARAARTRLEAASEARERADTRRAEVYTAEADYAPEDGGTVKDSRWGSSYRWVPEISARYARGESQLVIAAALGLSQRYVCDLVHKYGIVKGPKKSE